MGGGADGKDNGKGGKDGKDVDRAKALPSPAAKKRKTKKDQEVKPGNGPPGPDTDGKNDGKHGSPA